MKQKPFSYDKDLKKALILTSVLFCFASPRYTISPAVNKLPQNLKKMQQN